MNILRNKYAKINPLIRIINPVIVNKYLENFISINNRDPMTKYYISLFHHISRLHEV